MPRAPKPPAPKPGNPLRDTDARLITLVSRRRNARLKGDTELALSLSDTINAELDNRLDQMGQTSEGVQVAA